jgi:glycosyltransferase involved in cell wall biosynthesis
LIYALNSVKVCGVNDFECIIIDDASTDGSVNEIRRFIKNDSRFILIENKENMGASVARNIGLKFASGEYVAFLDSDDEFVPNSIGAIMDIAIQNDADIVGGRMVNLGFKIDKLQATEFIIYYNYKTDFIRSLMQTNSCLDFICRRIYRRDVLQDVLFVPNINIMEDSIFILDIMPNVGKFIESNVPVLIHKCVPNSAISSAFCNKTFDYIQKVMMHLYNYTFADGRYSKIAKDYFYKKLYDAIYVNVIKLSLKHIEFIPYIKQMLKQIYGTKYMPKKYFTMRQRIGVALYLF